MTNNDYSACIQACIDCALACEKCSTACLLEKDVTPMSKCILHDRDCADVCRLAAVLMVRDATHAPQFCALCAEFCDACGEECAETRPRALQGVCGGVQEVRGRLPGDGRQLRQVSRRVGHASLGESGAAVVASAAQPAVNVAAGVTTP